MFCKVCGSVNENGAVTCVCGSVLRRATDDPNETQDESPEEVPDGIKGFNFGALVLNWIWCIAHDLWLYAILCVLPIVNVFMILYLGFKGNELAWKSRRFKSVQQFNDTQHAWSVAATVLILLLMVAYVAMFVTIGMPNMRMEKEEAQYQVCVETLNSVKMAEELHVADSVSYTDDMSKLGRHVIPDCVAADGCATQAKERISEACDNFSINVKNGGTDYELRATAKYAKGCRICMNRVETYPDNYWDCDGSSGKCQ